LESSFDNHGVANAVEIKTLFVIDSEKNSEKGYGTLLVQQVLGSAVTLGASSVAVTVSENKPESLAFFQSKGFVIDHTFADKYFAGIKEYLLKFQF
jgi:L-amino acid N-acyltransferase YncA